MRAGGKVPNWAPRPRHNWRSLPGEAAGVRGGELASQLLGGSQTRVQVWALPHSGCMGQTTSLNLSCSSIKWGKSNPTACVCVCGGGGCGVQPHPGKNPNTRLDVDSAGSLHAQEPRRQGDRRATDSPGVSSLKGTRKLTSGVCCYRKGCCTTCETRTKGGKCIHRHVCVCARVCTCVHYVSRTPICLRNPEMLRPQALLGAQEPG